MINHNLPEQNNNQDFKLIKRSALTPRLLVRGLIFGSCGTFIFLEVQRFGGTAAVWGAFGALSGLAIPIVWDAFKKMKEKEEAFQTEVDARFDRLEQRLPSFMTHSELDTLRADIGIARANCDLALRMSGMASDTARSNQDRINEIISSGVIFQLTQNVTGLKIKMALLQKLIQDKPITASVKDLLNEISE
jgi:hypothetical protein